VIKNFPPAKIFNTVSDTFSHSPGHGPNHRTISEQSVGHRSKTLITVTSLNDVADDGYNNAIAYNVPKINKQFAMWKFIRVICRSL